MRRFYRIWTAEDEAVVLAGIKAGHTHASIAQQLGGRHTPNQVSAKVYSLRRYNADLPRNRPNTERRPRTCLRCRQTFASEGPGNRICGACKPLVDEAAPIAAGVCW